MKKSIEELRKIREKTLEKLNNRSSEHDYRIVIGMATCGISAGARDTLLELMRKIEDRGLSNVAVSQTGCMGLCSVEPIIEVYDREGAKTTYVQMTSDRASRLIEEHIIGGAKIAEYMYKDGAAPNGEGN
jgi:NADP-reducing hydrogenase subunit HndB